MVGSEITGKLFTKTVRGLPSGFSLSDLSQVLIPVETLRVWRDERSVSVPSYFYNHNFLKLKGILFTSRYIKSRSLLNVGIEHGLWRDFLFKVRFVWYTYSGSIGN